MSTKFEKIVVVGAGPTGLTLALLLAERGITVDVLESLEQVDQRPRGVAYGSPAVKVLGRAGVLDEIRSQTFDVRDMAWRNIDGEFLVGLDGLAEDQNPDRFCLFPVHRLSNLLMEHVERQPRITVHYSHKVFAVGQDDKKAWVEVQTSDGPKTCTGDYIVGCDGASSGVRKAQYGEEFPGFTWPQQLIATNVRYDPSKFGWDDLQWIIHPEHWGVVCRLESPDIWRIAYGEDMSLSAEQLRSRLPEKFEILLPGHPKPEDYEVLRFSPFVMHQRCVEKMRNGRILLAGDAAHLCNPMGGLGLTGGLSDIGSLVDCFYGILDGKTDDSILDKWDEVRRKIYKEYIGPLSTTNLQRLSKDPAEVSANDPFFKMMAEASKDPRLAKELQMREMVIGHDMTQYFENCSS